MTVLPILFEIETESINKYGLDLWEAELGVVRNQTQDPLYIMNEQNKGVLNPLNKAHFSEICVF